MTDNEGPVVSIPPPRAPRKQGQLRKRGPPTSPATTASQLSSGHPNGLPPCSLYHCDSLTYLLSFIGSKDVFALSAESESDSEPYESVTETDDPYETEAAEASAESDEDGPEGDEVAAGKLTVAKKRFLEEVSIPTLYLYRGHTDLCYDIAS